MMMMMMSGPSNSNSNGSSSSINNNPIINDNDVLCGRGGMTNSHIGNKRFRIIVAEYQYEYLMARKKEKKNIASRIVSRINTNGGRFLIKQQKQKQRNFTGEDNNNDSVIVWLEVTHQKTILAKTSQALREGLDVKNNTIRTRTRTPVPTRTATSRKVSSSVVMDSTVTNRNPNRATTTTTTTRNKCRGASAANEVKRLVIVDSSSSLLLSSSLHKRIKTTSTIEGDAEAGRVGVLVEEDIVPDLVQDDDHHQHDDNDDESSTTLSPTLMFSPMFVFSEVENIQGI